MKSHLVSFQNVFYLKRLGVALNGMLQICKYFAVDIKPVFSSNVLSNQLYGTAVGITADQVTNESGHGRLCIPLPTVCLCIHAPKYQRLNAHSRPSQNERSTLALNAQEIGAQEKLAPELVIVNLKARLLTQL